MPQIERRNRKRSDTETTTIYTPSTAVIIIILIICFVGFVWWISIYIRSSSIDSTSGRLIVIAANTFVSPVAGEISLQLLK